MSSKKKSCLINVPLIASTKLPISMKPPWSLSALSLVIRPTVAPPCLNKGNLLLLRSSFLFCLAQTMPYTSHLYLCDPMDCSLSGSSLHGILQARILEWVAISFSRGSSQPRDQTWVSWVSCIGRWILYHWARKAPLIYTKCQFKTVFTT